MQRIVGVLLAGGASARFGGNKLTAQVDGCAIGLLAARTLAAVTHEIIVVVPPDRPATIALFEREFPVSVCADARKGIGHSIAHGVGRTAAADGWLIALADMPLIKIETVEAVKAALSSR
ncbi:MAG: nucleotidyltransferase family protein, partial [Gammaproteobacteria bacterium]